MADAGENTFLTDVQTLRERAKKSIEKGAVTPAYQGNVQTAIDLLQTVVATELVCVLRYTMHSISVTGITSESVASEFATHAKEERAHMMWAADRIDQLGGVPNLSPEGLATRSATEYGDGGNLVEMVRQNLVAERLVIEHYRELIRYFADHDPTTRIMLEKILAEEEDHATDMHDLLVAHEGRPFLAS
ncbi:MULTISPECIES: ferritin-like domain-containing protein [Komagataeibacter]|uniref:Bacterioferritin n=2 Tax=Komagataeibacter TaxID=1434011 RepID=A0A0D6Q8G8_KOMXY|nr:MULTISPECIES: ferritin-like domain-containing protein [Komagataeibacter]MBL7233933.1 ferritin-like domain-containing protein [Komagataeibacter oboediens]MBT0674052.1 ferritin-like domain-containing protein [Komagataeibacter oboediens]MBT0677226.1 ferritin-like domain-containing protein [Komagataeibacter oboediens]MBV0887157.1 ferritin-like domain-containing protein [Komagataeibacter oboediens]MBV1824068.1 ferritin-like domain-containing protein [Komagataeibacter oboediens]